MTEEPLVMVPIPPLVTMLMHHEREKGSPLTEAEVLAIRDGAVCITMRRSHAERMAASRGYDDVSPENVWRDWNAFRAKVIP